MGQVTWDTPPTEEELGGVQTTVDWDTPPTKEELVGVQEAPVVTEEGQKAVGEEVSEVTAEVQQAITTIGDQLGWTDDSKKSMDKFEKEVSRVLNDRGYTVQRRGDQLVAVSSGGAEVPVEAGMWDSLKASTGEVLGGVGAGMAGGAAGGSVAGPWGAIGGGIIGGAMGAIAGDQADVSRHADKHDIHITPEERMDRAVEVGITDVGAGIVGGALLGTVGKTYLASDTLVRNVFGGDVRGANTVFTSIKDASAPVQKAIRNLQEKSGMSDELVEQTIKDYAKTVEGDLSAGNVVEALAKSAEKEQTGYAIAAMDDSVAKSGAIDEMTKRTKEIEKAFKGDAELEAVLKKNTVHDEGRRKATDWSGLHNDLTSLGFEAGDPIYDIVAQNAKSLGSKESDIFKATVKPKKASEGVVETLSPFADTARGSIKSQLFATGIQSVDNFLTRVLPNADATTVKIIKSSMKQNTDPKKLSDELIEQGHEVQLARKVAREVEALKAQEAKEAEKVAAREAKEAEKAAVKKEKDFEKIIAKDEKPSIEAGVDKDVAEFKKTKATMQKDKATKEKEFEKIIAKDEKSSIEAGVDKDVAEFKKTKESMIKEDNLLKIEGQKKLNDQIDLDVIETLDGIKQTATEAKKLKQLAKIAKRTGDDSDISNFVKAKQDILGKKKASSERKTKLDALKKEADKEEKPSAMTAGLKQTTMDLEDEGLFATPKAEPKKPARKPTPNQVEAKKLQEANPDDKEAIKKALTRKSPEVEAKARAEEGLAKEKYERSLDPRTDAEIKANDAVEKALESGTELYDTKHVYNKTMVKETIPKRAKEFSKWTDENPTKEFLHYAKEKQLSDKEVKAYYDGRGQDVPKSWAEPKKEASKAMEAGIKKGRDYTKDIGEEGQKAYEAWAKDVVKYTKEGSNPNVSLNKFRRSSAGKPYRIKGD